jgi:5-methylcytosine-specific restriction endonuclease McrA
MKDAADRIELRRVAHWRWYEENTDARWMYRRPCDVDYRTYLESDAWMVFRESVIEAFGGQCADCGQHLPLQVHHLHYNTLGWEVIDDVAPLCRECHVVADEVRKEIVTARKLVANRRRFKVAGQA